jgi:hypothetical protein
MNKGTSMKSFALIDSGATTSFLPKELADILSIDPIKEKISATGAGGDFTTWLGSLKIEVIKGTSICWTNNVIFNIPDEDKRIPYVILGRDSIFKDYDISFKENNEITIFRTSRR